MCPYRPWNCSQITYMNLFASWNKRETPAPCSLGEHMFGAQNQFTPHVFGDCAAAKLMNGILHSFSWSLQYRSHISWPLLQLPRLAKKKSSNSSLPANLLYEEILSKRLKHHQFLQQEFYLKLHLSLKMEKCVLFLCLKMNLLLVQSYHAIVPTKHFLVSFARMVQFFHWIICLYAGHVHGIT